MTKGKKFFLVFSSILVCIYLGKLFGHETFITKANLKGLAVSETINLAFGQNYYFPQIKTLEPLLPKNYLSQCLTKTDADKPSCVLAYANGEGVNVYHAECKWWRFEVCSPITVDPLLVLEGETLAVLKKVISKPCMYLPTEEQIHEAEQKAQYESYKAAIRQFSTYRQELQCSNESPTKAKIAVGIMRDKSNSKGFVEFTL